MNLHLSNLQNPLPETHQPAASDEPQEQSNPVEIDEQSFATGDTTFSVDDNFQFDENQET